MHRSKGLEFRVVVVMACDDEVIPLQERIETVDRRRPIWKKSTTQNVTCSMSPVPRPDHLLVTSGGPASEFLDDLGQ